MVAGLGSWGAVREADPERRYERRVAPLLAKLEKGEEVEVIGKGPALPPHRLRSAARMVSVLRGDEGVTINSPSVALVEFLPRVPWPSYRIEAEIRHDHSNFQFQGFTGIGVVFTGRSVSARRVGFITSPESSGSTTVPWLPRPHRASRLR